MHQVPQTREEFERLVLSAKAGGLPFLKALFEVMDVLTSQARAGENPPLACRQGCSFCCHQVVTCTKMEWRVIYEYLLNKGLFRLIGARLRQGADEWRKFYFSCQDQWAHDPFRIRSALGNRACVYLNDAGQCDIYPVRPLPCRVHVSQARCDDHEGRDAQNFRYPWEVWGNNWQIEEDIKSNGQGRNCVTPLPHWLCTIRF